MLTRFRVSGFKNLLDTDLRFGPFTCVAGANGVGKSNLFDAIGFLSLLADHPLLEAAAAVRGGHPGSGDPAGVRSLFHRVGERVGEEMSFWAEMIVPAAGRDELGQEVRATTTFLTYELVLARRELEGPGSPLEIVREELRHVARGQAHKHLPFKHSAARWRSSAVLGERRVPLISTVDEDGARVILRHKDGGTGGHPSRYAAARLPRTVLSGCNTAEHPTALLARREMQSWRLLQLEPAALRRGDELTSPSLLGPDGSHLAATLYRLSRDDDGVYARVGERLARLVDEVRSVRVDHDERRQTLTLEATDRTGTPYPASSLSGGSLRFLALAVLERDPESQGLLCVEEPENGVHPERVPALLELLQEMAVDVDEPLSAQNPLRQIIVNTHSPAVVTQVSEESVLVALLKEARSDEVGPFRKVELHPLPGTWRAKLPGSKEPVPYDEMLAYLNPLTVSAAWRPVVKKRRRRGGDEGPLLPFG